MNIFSLCNGTRSHSTELTFVTDVPLTSTSLLQGVVSACVQIFYAWRVKIMTRNIWIVILILICTTTSMCERRLQAGCLSQSLILQFTVASIGASIAMGSLPQFTEFYKCRVIVVIW